MHGIHSGTERLEEVIKVAEIYTTLFDTDRLQIRQVLCFKVQKNDFALNKCLQNSSTRSLHQIVMIKLVRMSIFEGKISMLSDFQ